MSTHKPLFDIVGRNSEPEWAPRRHKVWDVGGGLQCSIVGTCLSHEDLERTARKCGVKLRPDLTNYDMHAFFVREASSATKIAAALQRLLDKRYAIIIDKLESCGSEAERTALWASEVSSGRVAGAYWAYMTDSRVERRLLTRIFGEVHMLSHVHGRLAHQNLSRVSEMQSTIEQLEARLNRMSLRNRELAAERDTAAAEAEALRTAPRVTPPAERRNALPAAEAARMLERRERSLVAARGRARAAERCQQELQEKVTRLEILARARHGIPAAPCPAAEACEQEIRRDIARRILYIGGRSGMIEPLRRIAEDSSATLVHHDGGQEQSVGRIGAMIEACDVVFCPIDCVSHSACTRAKALCKKLNKPFVPLRSSGATSFQRALVSLGA